MTNMIGSPPTIMRSLISRRSLAACAAALLAFGCSRSPEERLKAAAAGGDAKTISALLKKGARVDAVDEDGWTPLLWAASSGGPESIEALLDGGASIGAVTRKEREAALTLASKWNQAATVQALLKRGASIEARDDISWTALMWASLQGRADVVAVLLDAGASFQAVDADGNTPLMLAASRGRADVVRILLAHGANPHARNAAGDTAATLAAAAGHADVAALVK